MVVVVFKVTDEYTLLTYVTSNRAPVPCEPTLFAGTSLNVPVPSFAVPDTTFVPVTPPVFTSIEIISISKSFVGLSPPKLLPATLILFPASYPLPWTVIASTV